MVAQLTHVEWRRLVDGGGCVLGGPAFLLGVPGGGGRTAATSGTAGGELKAPHSGHGIVGVLNPTASILPSERK